MVDRDIDKVAASMAQANAQMATSAFQAMTHTSQSTLIAAAGTGEAATKTPNGVLALDDARQALLPQGQPVSDALVARPAAEAASASPLRALVEANWFSQASLGLVVFNVVVMWCGEPRALVYTQHPVSPTRSAPSPACTRS